MGLETGPDVVPPPGAWLRRLRVTAGVALVVVFALRAAFSAAVFVAQAPRTTPPGKDAVGDTERRLRRVGALLPPRGVVGYRAGGRLRVGANHELMGDDRSIARYVLSQYVLAPRILDLNIDPDRARLPVIRDDLDPPALSTPEGP